MLTTLRLMHSTNFYCAELNGSRQSRKAFAVIVAKIGLIFVFKQRENVSGRHTLKTQPIFPKIAVHIHMGCMNNKNICLWGLAILRWTQSMHFALFWPFLRHFPTPHFHPKLLFCLISPYLGTVDPQFFVGLLEHVCTLILTAHTPCQARASVFPGSRPVQPRTYSIMYE